MLDKDKKDDNDSDNDKNEKNGEDKKKDKKPRIITYRLRFIDSCRFMQDSLSTLVDNLSGVNDKVSETDKKISHAALIENFSNTYQLCNNELNKFALFLRKGVYPYEDRDSWKRFKEELFPDKESFYSKLNKEHITDEEYVHVQKVRDTFKIKNLGEYHDLYVQSDTALVADVFEKFRDKCLETDELDPAHFLSVPGLSWKTCLKKTKVELELLTDTDMLLMFEKGIREGMCQVICRYAEANNKYMNNYDKNKVSSYLVYLDANNLYGYAMSKKLPIRNFKWLDKDDISKFNDELIKKYDENSDIGCIFEVDIEYSKHIRMLHSDLPFLPERMKINKSTKLFCNVQDKKNYLVQVLALQQALDYGLKITKIHEIIQFDQEAWLKPYVDMNTILRRETKNDFEKDFCKLKINAFCGKTMENARNHRDIRIVATFKRRCILASEPNYHSTKYISKDLQKDRSENE